MSVYRCNHCKHIGENLQQNEQTQAKCANCGHDVTVYDTVYFIKNILNRWAAAVRELNALQSQEQDNGLPADIERRVRAGGENAVGEHGRRGTNVAPA